MTAFFSALDGVFAETPPPKISPDFRDAFAPLKDDGLKVKHVQTFSGMIGGVAKTYRWAFDEALRNNPDDALAMRRDGYLFSLLRERQKPTSRASWHLEPENEKDKRQIQAAELVTKCLEKTPRFSMLRLNLLESLWYGKYAVQMTACRQNICGKSCWTIGRHQPVHGDKIIHRWDGTPGVLINGTVAGYYREQGATVLPTDRGMALFLETPAWRSRFAIHQHESEDADFYEAEQAGLLHGAGLRHRVYWLWSLRFEVMAWLLDYLSRVGAGGLTIVYYEEGNPKSLAAAETAAKQLQAGNIILCPRPIGTEKQGNGVERIEPSQVGSAVLIDIIDRLFEHKIERLFVGQTLSSGTEGSGLGGTGVAMLHADTKYQLISGDAEDLDETITQDVVQQLLKWNVPGADFTLKFVSDISKPDPKNVLEAVQIAVGVGCEFIEDEVRALTSLSKPQPGDKTVGGVQAMQTPADALGRQIAAKHFGQNGANGNGALGTAIERLKQRVQGSPLPDAIDKLKERMTGGDPLQQGLDALGDELVISDGLDKVKDAI